MRKFAIILLYWSLYILPLQAPAYAGYRLWTGIIKPWVFMPSATDMMGDEDEEKNRKKRERVKYKRI